MFHHIFYLILKLTLCDIILLTNIVHTRRYTNFDSLLYSDRVKTVTLFSNFSTPTVGRQAHRILLVNFSF